MADDAAAPADANAAPAANATLRPPTGFATRYDGNMDDLDAWRTGHKLAASRAKHGFGRDIFDDTAAFKAKDAAVRQTESLAWAAFQLETLGPTMLRHYSTSHQVRVAR